jgi:catechol 2,3-dioxygenase-like lactoylglutathione lyase family enzyme
MQAKFTYIGIRVKDLEKSIDFYTRVLGMKLAGRGKIEKTKGETVGRAKKRGSLWSSTITSKTAHISPSMLREKA